jgi:hypothetical protein
MRNLLHRIGGAIAAALFVAGVMATVLIIPASAQPLGPPGARSFPPREFLSQQTHYLRFTFNYNSCVIPAGAAVCALKVGTLPYNAFLTQINLDLITVFNPTTSATIGLSTAATGATILAAQNVFTGATLGAAPYVFCGTSCGAASFAGIGVAVTGAGIAQSGTLGGFDVYAVYTTGANGSQGTTGSLVGIIQYIAPNDGNCIAVPLGATAVAC